VKGIVEKMDIPSAKQCLVQSNVGVIDGVHRFDNLIELILMTKVIDGRMIG
jgi:hypothetical protein